MKQSANLIYCVGLTLFFLLIKDSFAEDVRIWTHANGKSIAGTLKEFKDDEAVIVFGSREIRVKLDDLSPKDRNYLLKISDQSKDAQPESHDQPAKNGGAGKTKEEKKSDLNVQPLVVEKALPMEMLDFVNLINTFTDKYNKAKNELQKSALRTERQEKLKQILVNRGVRNWIGCISVMRTDSDRNAVIRVLLNTNGATSTDGEICAINITNNKAPIKHGSDFYKRISSYTVGDVVIFSGEFLESKDDHLLETSITEWGSMTSPEFEFRFSEVLKGN